MCIKVSCICFSVISAVLADFSLIYLLFRTLAIASGTFKIIFYYEMLGLRQMEFAAVLRLCYGQITEQTEFFLLFLTISFLYCLILQIKNKKEIFLSKISFTLFLRTWGSCTVWILLVECSICSQ